MLRYYLMTAFRNFGRYRFQTGINVLCLAIGLTCFVAATGTVQYLRGSDRYWKNTDRIVVITQRLRNAERGFDTGILTVTSAPVAGHLRSDMPELEAVARIEDINDDVALMAENGSKLAAKVAGAEADFPRIFDLDFLEGSGAGALDSPGSIVISSDLARKLFGTETALGKTILLENSTEAAITGVFEPIRQPSHMGSSATSVVRFDALISIDVLHELARKARGRSRDEEPATNQWGSARFLTYALLPETRAARSQLDAVLGNLAARHVSPDRLRSTRYEFGAMPVSSIMVSDLDSSLTRGSGLSIMGGLQLLGLLVLLMSCLNYANSVSAQVLAKSRETAVQKVLGARSSHILVQPILEATLLALLGGGLAVVTLSATLPLLSGFAPGLNDMVRDIAIDLVPSLMAIIIVVGFVAGIYPGFVMNKVRPVEFLRTSRSRSGQAYGAKVFVGLQFGVASLLLIVVFYVYTQNGKMREMAVAPDADPKVVITTDLRSAKVDFPSLQAELLRVPQIKAVATLNELPWVDNFGTAVLGRTDGNQYHEIQPVFHIVSHDFLSALDIPLLAGRTFDPAYGDDMMPAGDIGLLDRGRAYGVVIDRAAAEQLGYSTPASASGEVIEIPFSRVGLGEDQPVRIIGVVESHPLMATAPAAGISAAMYVLMPPGIGYPIIRIDRRDPASALAAIDAVWNRFAPNFPVNRRFMDELFEQSYVIYDRIGKFAALLMSAAFAVAFLGMFGMANFVAARRTHEIGVRKSMGARSTEIILMLVKDFSIPVLIAGVAAWPLAYTASQAYLAPFLQRVSITPGPFLFSLAAITVIAWLAISGQTLRAARLNPATVLKYE